MSMRLRFLLLCGAVSLAFASAPTPSRAATITIVNMDAAGEGFNDPTPAAPVGGNTGTTVGQQRLNVFNRAAAIWGPLLPSSVTIKVQARFDPLGCGATSAVLGSAGTINVVRDFAGAEFSSTWYHTALGNKLAGNDLVPSGNDISATFNANLGQSGCMPGTWFYYGLDHEEGDDVDLLAVVLHELGHGLGFSSFVNSSTGTQLSGMPGIYDRKLYDHTTGLHWNQMTDAQRAASAINSGNVVFDGTATAIKAYQVLAPRNEVVITAPAAIAATYISGSASFGGNTASGVTGQVALAPDGGGAVNDACEAIVNPAAIAGKIALVDRGTCGFTNKAKNVQNAGAIGMIMINDANGPAPDLGGADPSITIPVASVNLATGNAIKAQLASGVTATLRLSNEHVAGADDQNRPRIFTPNPVQPGSSVSHFDLSATPNLLMEPYINSDLTGIDLTLPAFEDLGWLPHTTAVGPPAVAGTRLGAAAPNPFAARTRVHFSLPRPLPLRVDVIDLSGRLVRTLVDAPVASGAQDVTWDGSDAAGRRASPGVYLVRIKAGSEIQSTRVALVK